MSIVQILTTFENSVGAFVFIPTLALFGFFLSIKLIPLATDMMVNAAAGLAGHHLGRQYRTLVINCSTNNPEVATMIVTLLIYAGADRYAGIGTPLGSNLANIYLIFIVAFGWTLSKMWWKNRASFWQLIALIKRERYLVIWHLAMSIAMFAMATLAFQLIPKATPASKLNIFCAALLCLGGVSFYIWRDASLRAARPELFEDIDEEAHVASWKTFAIGTLGLFLCCYLLNEMFAAATRLYGPALAVVLGPSVFAMLHFFLGALVTSLPEMNVAVSNYRRIESPDLNTALASASASNMSNLAIAGLGCLLALMIG